MSILYSFEDVLCKIITGCKTIKRTKPLSDLKLLEWVKLYHVDSKSFGMIIDSKLWHMHEISMVKELIRSLTFYLSTLLTLQTRF